MQKLPLTPQTSVTVCQRVVHHWFFVRKVLYYCHLCLANTGVVAVIFELIEVIMGQNGFWWFIAILLFIVGLVLFVKGVLGNNKKPLSADELEHKDGIPITPRTHRRIVPIDGKSDDEQAKTGDDALSSLANVAAARTTKPEEQAQTVAQTPTTPADVSHNPAYHEPEPALTATEGATQADDSVQSEPTNVAISDVFEVDISHEFAEDSPALDEYFYQNAQEALYNNDVLFGYKQTVTIIVSPRNSFEGVDGTKIMEIVRQYGLKYGILNMFHRYEDPKGAGMLWFSMLGVGVDGVEAFDLVELPNMNYRGLALFLSLPHPQALRGFDGMVQTAKSIAEELNAEIHDEAGYILDATQLQALRAWVSEQVGA